jgi:hypothetical protein
MRMNAQQTARQAAARRSCTVSVGLFGSVSYHLCSFFPFTLLSQAKGWVLYAEAQSIEQVLVNLHHVEGATWIACNNVRRP